MTDSANVSGAVYERNDVIFLVLASQRERVVLAPILSESAGRKREDVPITDTGDLRDIGVVGSRWLVRVSDLFECWAFVATAKGTMPAQLIAQVQTAARSAALALVYERRNLCLTEHVWPANEWLDRLRARPGGSTSSMALASDGACRRLRAGTA